jgi:hypothetical protein
MSMAAFMAAATMASMALGAKSSMSQAELQKQQMKNQQTQQRISASEQTQNRLRQMGQANTQVMQQNALSGLAMGNNQQQAYGEYMAAQQDIAAIDYNAMIGQAGTAISGQSNISRSQNKALMSLMSGGQSLNENEQGRKDLMAFGSSMFSMFGG